VVAQEAIANARSAAAIAGIRPVKSLFATAQCFIIPPLDSWPRQAYGSLLPEPRVAITIFEPEGMEARADGMHHMAMKTRRLILAIALTTLFALEISVPMVTDSSENDHAARTAEVLRNVLKKLQSGQKVDPAEFQEFVKAQNDGAVTGPKLGEHVPDFTLADQTGKQWSLHDLMGPKGLLLVFTRSADW
jgi:hypothetical protein